jgi:type IV pilus assembly protein PilE
MRPQSRPGRSRGFTIIELMIGLAIVGVLMAVALPSYTSYTQRSKVPPGLDALSAYATRMEQRYQDTGNYGTGGCAVAVPAAANFTVTCALGTGGQTFTATATGSGPMSGYSYTINSAGVRATTAHPKGANTTCWTTRGSSCDT